jgi:hypothetical protein
MQLELAHALVAEAVKIAFQPSVLSGQPGHAASSDEREQPANDGHDQEERAHARQRSPAVKVMAVQNTCRITSRSVSQGS